MPLHQHLNASTFALQSEDAVIEEIKCLIEALADINGVLTSDHAMNLLPEIEGRLTTDKETLLNVIADYQALSPQDRLIFRLGRFSGVFQSTREMAFSSEAYQRIADLVTTLQTTMDENALEQYLLHHTRRLI